MKHTTKFLLLTAFTANQAFAAVGVAIGANQISTSDGFPILQKNEQVKAFYCHGNMSGAAIQSCAITKCLNFFKIKNPKKEKIGNSEVHGGKCIADGWSERNGYAILYVGPKGNNQFLVSKAIGDKTREEALNYVKENNFPIELSTKVFDFYDDGKNGNDKP